MICIGPYAPHVLRFHVSFPSGYPNLPPLITFITDIFHPLVTPVTTYTYGASTPESGANRAADEQPLPPGGFGLTDGFPRWFGGSERSTTSSLNSLHNAAAQAEPPEHGKLPCTTPEVQLSAEHMPPRASIASVLDYVKRSFDDDDVLNRLPAEAATNPGAWKAWQAYHYSNAESSRDQTNTIQDQHQSHSSKGQARHPDDWSWEGVWERRVRKGIDASISDQVLFGASGGDEMVGLRLFSKANGTDILIADSFCPNIRRASRRTRRDNLSCCTLSCLGTMKTRGLPATWLEEQWTWTSSFTSSVLVSSTPAHSCLRLSITRCMMIVVWGLGCSFLTRQPSPPVSTSLSFEPRTRSKRQHLHSQ